MPATATCVFALTLYFEDLIVMRVMPVCVCADTIHWISCCSHTIQFLCVDCNLCHVQLVIYNVIVKTYVSISQYLYQVPNSKQVYFKYVKSILYVLISSAVWLEATFLYLHFSISCQLRGEPLILNPDGHSRDNTLSSSKKWTQANLTFCPIFNRPEAESIWHFRMVVGLFQSYSKLL